MQACPSSGPPEAECAAMDPDLASDLGKERVAIMLESGVSLREAAAYVLKRYGVALETGSPAVLGVAVAGPPLSRS